MWSRESLRRKAPKLLLQKFQPVLIRCTIFLGLLTLTGFCGLWAWALELTSHFRVQYAVLLLGCLLYYSYLKKRGWLLFSSFFLCLNLFQVVDLKSPFRSAIAAQQIQDEISLLQINVYKLNRHPEKVLDYIQKMDPDILALAEIDERWWVFLKDVLEGYPHQKYALRDDFFGIGLFSKVPVENMEIEVYGNSGMESVVATLLFPSQKVSLLFTHLLAPLSPGNFSIRNNQLEDIARRRRSMKEFRRFSAKTFSGPHGRGL